MKNIWKIWDFLGKFFKPKPKVADQTRATKNWPDLMGVKKFSSGSAHDKKGPRGVISSKWAYISLWICGKVHTKMGEVWSKNSSVIVKYSLFGIHILVVGLQPESLALFRIGLLPASRPRPFGLSDPILSVFRVLAHPGHGVNWKWGLCLWGWGLVARVQTYPQADLSPCWASFWFVNSFFSKKVSFSF